MSGNESNNSRDESPCGLSVLVTRPRAGAEQLARKLAALGITPIVAPMIEIKPLSKPHLPLGSISKAGADVLIFVSTHAASCGVPQLPVGVLEKAMVIAVGASTAKMIRSAWPKALSNPLPADVLVPSSDYNSEALLQLSALNEDAIADKQVLIVRGVGGREHLAAELRNRGANVAYFEVYERVETTELLRVTLNHHQVECPSIGVVTSVQSMSILAEKISSEKLTSLFDMQILATGTRIAAEVPNYGFTKPPLIADNPTSESIAACLQQIMEKL